MLKYWEFIKESDTLLRDDIQEVFNEYENIMIRLTPLYNYMAENKMANRVFELMDTRFGVLSDNVEFINNWHGGGIGDYEDTEDMKKMNSVVLSYKLLQSVETLKFPKHSKIDETVHVFTEMCDDFEVPITFLGITQDYDVPATKIIRDTEFTPYYFGVVQVSSKIDEKLLENAFDKYIKEFSDMDLELLKPYEMDRLGDDSWLVKLNIKEINT
jgi:hypothetical protein